jgi:putative oxidoreductase
VFVFVLGFEAEPPDRGGALTNAGENAAMLQLEKHSDIATLVSRLFMSSLFILYGYFKLTGYAGTVAYMTKLGLPGFFAALAVIIELGGGLLILFGYQTRLVALGCAIYVLVAALIAHNNFADGGQLTHFMKNMAIVGGFLALMVSGAGPYSLDGRKS